MYNQDCKIMTWYNTKLDSAVVPNMLKRGYTPTRAAVCAFIFALLTPVGFFLHSFWGFLTLILSGFFFTLSERLKQTSQDHQPISDFFVDLMHKSSHLLYLIGFWVAAYMQSQWIVQASICIFLALVLLSLTEYVSERISALNLSDTSGLMNWTGRTVYFVIWSLLMFVFSAGGEGIFWIGVIVFIALECITLIQKSAFVLRRL